jgi:hypothetical protein
MASWLELYTPGDSLTVALAKKFRDQALAAAGQVEAAREEVATNQGLVADGGVVWQCRRGLPARGLVRL